MLVCVCVCVCVLQIKNRLHEAFGDAGTRELTEEQVPSYPSSSGYGIG